MALVTWRRFEPVEKKVMEMTTWIGAGNTRKAAQEIVLALVIHIRYVREDLVEE